MCTVERIFRTSTERDGRKVAEEKDEEERSEDLITCLLHRINLKEFELHFGLFAASKDYPSGKSLLFPPHLSASLFVGIKKHLSASPLVFVGIQKHLLVFVSISMYFSAFIGTSFSICRY